VYGQTPSQAALTRDFNKRKYLCRDLIGKTVPFSTLTTLDHEKIDFHSLENKLVFINFWFKACPACMSEMQGLNELYQKYHGEKTIFLMITFENPEVIKEIAGKYHLKYQMVSMKKTNMQNWDIPKHGFPTCLLVGPEGKIIAAITGSNQNEKIAARQLMEYFGPAIRSLTAR
jgi:peroxiredoxin